jgi:hypothetical protein
MHKKNLIPLLTTLLFLGGCAIIPLEERRQSTLHLFAAQCPSDNYYRAAENSHTKQEWKMQYEYICKDDIELVKKHPSLDGKIYHRADFKKYDVNWEKDMNKKPEGPFNPEEHIYTIIMP